MSDRYVPNELIPDLPDDGRFYNKATGEYNFSQPEIRTMGQPCTILLVLDLHVYEALNRIIATEALTGRKLYLPTAATYAINKCGEREEGFTAQEIAHVLRKRRRDGEFKRPGVSTPKDMQIRVPDIQYEALLHMQACLERHGVPTSRRITARYCVLFCDYLLNEDARL